MIIVGNCPKLPQKWIEEELVLRRLKRINVTQGPKWVVF